MVRRWAATAGNKRKDDEDSRAGSLLALAYPDRVARNCGGGGGHFCSPMAAAA